MSEKEQLLEDGFVICRQVIPPRDLEKLRASADLLVERQGGRSWLGAGDAQPRLTIASLADGTTANAVEIWLAQRTQGLASRLLCSPETALTEMWIMCSPLTDHGPSHWHRDVHPIDMAPMQCLQADLVENGPRYLQWNIPLYDDDVLWVVPGSHRRLNSAAENAQMHRDRRVPLPGSVPVELRAGDGVAYVNYLLHWGSNYSTALRRTLHGGYSIFSLNGDIADDGFLSPAARETFAGWKTRTAQMQDLTESALRAAGRGDGRAFFEALTALQPGAGHAGRLVLSIYLCKAALLLRIVKNPDLGVPPALRKTSRTAHPISLNWGPAFADRFSRDESETVWQRFAGLDAALRGDEEQFVPGYQSGPMPYHFETMPVAFGVDDLVAGWSS